MQHEPQYDVDGYKTGHGPMYRKGTTKVGSNLTPRTDKIHLRNCTSFYDGKLVWVGAQQTVQELHDNWENGFFSKPKAQVIGDYREFLMGYLGMDLPTSDQLAALHDLGYLPLEFRSLPEGSLVPMGVPVMTVTNTLPEFYWLVNYQETAISANTWKTATNATIAREYKAICGHYLKVTGCYDAFTLSVMCHDFSMRGMSGVEDAARTGLGHLTSFIGTDSLAAIRHAKKMYGSAGVVGISVPATEHAVTSNNILSIEAEIEAGTYQFIDANQGMIFEMMDMNGESTRFIAEVMFIYDLIVRIVPTGIVSSVSDTYDFWAIISRGYKYLKHIIMSRQGNGVAPGKLVCRPDSGVPEDVICGYSTYKLLPSALGDEDMLLDNLHDAAYKQVPEAKRVEGKVYTIWAEHVDGMLVKAKASAYREYDGEMHMEIDHYEHNPEVTAEEKGAIRVLWEIFGGTTTETGHKLLDSHIGLIYGDSITTKRAEEILRRLEANGFAAANVLFGIGSYTYQCNTRDTFGFAVKATYTVIDGKEVAIFKEPKTDSKKKSAKGRLSVLRVNFPGSTEGVLELHDNVTEADEASSNNQLRVIYRNGVWMLKETLDTIRERLA